MTRREPTFTALVDWLEGRLAPDEHAAVAQAVASGDQHTRDAVAWIESFHEAAAGVPLVDPPAVVRQNLRGHFEAWYEAKRIISQTPIELTADLVFDSRYDLVVGVRGVSDHSSVHLAYGCAVADVVLDVTFGLPDQVNIDGQVMRVDSGAPRAFEAVANAPGRRVRSVDGTSDGRFSLRGLPQDATDLVVRNRELTIVLKLPRLRLGSGE